MTQGKLVSVVLCFYNEERYLAGAIDSVLAQTYDNFELILVSDGSTDRSCEIADTYTDPRIKRVYLKENEGLANARNAGYDAAQGEYIAHFDADDLLLPQKLERQVRYLDEHPDTVVVSCGYYPMSADGSVSEKPRLPRYCDDIDIRAAELLVPVIVNAGGPVFRRSLVTEHGVRNDPTMHWCEDFHFWHQCFPFGRVENIPEPLFCYRLSYGSKTQKMKSDRYDKFKDALYRALKFAWTNRGFSLEDDEVMFITTHIYKKMAAIGPLELARSGRLFAKIEKQADALGLPEKKRILEVYKEREHANLLHVRVLEKLKNIRK